MAPSASLKPLLLLLLLLLLLQLQLLLLLLLRRVGKIKFYEGLYQDAPHMMVPLELILQNTQRKIVVGIQRRPSFSINAIAYSHFVFVYCMDLLNRT